MTSLFRLSMFKRKFTLIKMCCLVCGLVIFFSIVLYVNHENSYDNWDPRLSEVYRVSRTTTNGGESILMPPPMGRFILDNNSDVLYTLRIQFPLKGSSETLISFKESRLYLKRLLSVDSNFLSAFPYPLEYGNSASAFGSVNSIVLTHALKQSLFGNTDPIGQVVQLNGATLYTVTGVIAGQPRLSHLEFDALVPLALPTALQDNWNFTACNTYVVFKPHTSPGSIRSSTRRVLDARLNKLPIFKNQPTQVTLMPVRDIHLFDASEQGGNRNFQLLLVSSLLAILVLIISCVNYINLTVSTSIIRQKELFVRRAIGSSSRQIFVDMLFESFIQISLSTVIALLLLIPMGNLLDSLLKTDLLSWNLSNLGWISLEAFVLILMLTILSGGYPALIFSRLKTGQLSKLNASPYAQRPVLRKVLLGFQFAISIFFVVVSLVMYRQMSYLDHYNLGFVPDQVVRLQSSYTIFTNYLSFKKELLSYSGVKSVTRCSNYPGDNVTTTQLPFEYKGASYDLDVVTVDFDFFQTMGIRFRSGRDFSLEYPTDLSKTLVINNAAARLLSLPMADGSQIANPCNHDSSHLQNIIGVVNDYNTEGFENVIRPAAYVIRSNCTTDKMAILIKISQQNVQGTLNNIAITWKTFDKVFPIRYFFVDDEFEKSIIVYQRMEKMFFFSTAALIIISLLGIFTLATFELDQRWKELSIRKVLGASFFDLFRDVNGRLVYLLLVSNVFAMPLAYLFTRSWLTRFAYRIPMPYGLYLLTFALSMAVALSIANLHVAKILALKPAEKLKNDG